MIKTLKISGVTKADLTTSNNRERYAWVKNNTGGNVYASVLDSTCTAGADNVAKIASGDVRMVDTLSLGYLWISGNGSVEIQLSDSVNCPFKLSQKGGDISAEGDSVQLDGLQGGVPFSEVIVRGDNIVGQELTVTACGKNLAKYPYVQSTRTLYGITYTDNGDGTITASGTHDGSSNLSFFAFSPWWSADYERPFIRKGETITYTVYGLPDNYNSVFNIMADKASNTLIKSFKSIGGAPITYTAEQDCYISCGVQGVPTVSIGATVDFTFYPQLEIGDTTTAYEPYSGADYTITPDSNPYTVPTEIYQQDGVNTVYVTGEGEPTLSVKGVKTNAAVKRIWDKLNELTTAIIVSNTGFNI